MIRVSWGFLLIPVLRLSLGIFSPALAEQSIPGEMRLHATIESVGVVVEYSGDNNENNQAEIRYRVLGANNWLLGPEMMVDRLANEWRVSLVYLSPGTSYEVQVRFEDPDGVVPATVEREIRTRPDYPNTGASGKTFYVPDDGILQEVIELASPGDLIRIRSGIYYETVTLDEQDSGEAGAYLTIEAEPGGQVILDGTDPSLNNPNVNNWARFSGNIYYTDLSWGNSACDERSRPGYVGEERDGDGVRYLFFKGSGEWSEFLSAPKGSAYYDCLGRLYVRTYNGDDPDNHEIHVSHKSYGIILEGADFIRIRDLEFQYFGTYGMFFTNPGADNNIIERNVFHGIGYYHLRIGNSPTFLSSDNLIQDNQFYENGYRDSGWTQEQQYDFAHSVGIRLLDAGPGNVIRRNYFTGGTDAISVVTHSHNTDIYENSIFGCMDDGIEVDSAPGQSIRVWRNYIQYCYSGISNQDWFRDNYTHSGPVYIFRNVIVGGNDPRQRSDRNGDIYFSAYAFKVGSDDGRIQPVFYYHNTIYMPDSDTNGNGIQDAGGNYFAGLVSRNNLWYVTRLVYKLRRPETVANHDLDCDSLYSSRVPDKDAFIQWSSTGGPDGDGFYSQLSDFQTVTGQELKGMQGGKTKFTINFRLASGSPEIDSGCLITGFNDRGPKKYLGALPDIGAYEYESDLFLLQLPIIRR
jgi:hypothetical protein